MRGPCTAGSTSVRVAFDEARVDALFHDLDQRELPGVAVGIAIGAQPVYRKGFGLMNMEQSAPLSPTTRMRIWSVSKHFTCLAFLLLCEEFKADLDAPIGNQLPELHRVAHSVTPRQLMGNISGLQDAFDVSWHINGTGRPISSEVLFGMYRELDTVNSDPGHTWRYNNGGFLILSMLVERIARKPLEEVLREKIFDPVGMRDTLLRRVDTDFVPNSAALHTANPAGGYCKAAFGTAIAGEGGIVSTVDDLLRWLAHMDSPTVGSPDTWNLLKTPLHLRNGLSTSYGLGLCHRNYRGLSTLDRKSVV